MKALILAAGFGTRLLPYTEHTPKPLFPIAGRPILEILIEDLIQAGADGIIINTHHLHEQIETFVANRKFPVPVLTRYEPAILGTGGAIRNTADFFDDAPFLVINGDIRTDIDLRKVYEHHRLHSDPATLVLHDYTEFNHVSVTRDNRIIGFHDPLDSKPDETVCRLAFTGIQVLNPDLIPTIREHDFFSSIDLYRHMIATDRRPAAFIARNHYWTDIGTPESYLDAAYKEAAPAAFKTAFAATAPGTISREKLKGDGSDRQWYRLRSEGRSLILACHGIRTTDEQCEVDAFIQIGRHLRLNAIPVPEIHCSDSFSGMVFLEDLGDVHLQKQVLSYRDHTDRIPLYKRVIEILVHMSFAGKNGFSSSMTYQTPSYSRELIIRNECHYFRDAFLKTCMQMTVPEPELENEFSCLADRALQDGITGFMHRDFQSRNIMVKDDAFFLIDFQGGRFGPLQYDLASLLVDPYVGLPFDEQLELIDFCRKTLKDRIILTPEAFRESVFYCILTRNLQILGAYGYLSGVKGKKWFEQYIPRAIQSLAYYLGKTDKNEFPVLTSIAEILASRRD